MRLSTLTLLVVASLFMALPATAQWTCGDPLIDSRDGQTYPTVQIGTQCWIAANMNYGTMISSSASGSVQTNNGVVEKFCWNNDVKYCDGTGGVTAKGGFYEWQEAVQYWNGQPGTPVQGVCPAGWHIPTQAEFDVLISALGGSSVAGTQLKPGGSSGFNGMLTGYRCTMNGGFLPSPTSNAYIAYYWTAQQSDGTSAWFYELNETNTAFGNGQYSPFYKSLGLSVRCVKDNTTAIVEPEDVKNLGIASIHTGQGTLEAGIVNTYPGTLHVEIFTLDGRSVFSQAIEAQGGYNQLTLHMAPLPAAAYILSIRTNDAQVSERFVIDR